MPEPVSRKGMGPVGDHAPQVVGGHGPTTFWVTARRGRVRNVVSAAASAHLCGGAAPVEVRDHPPQGIGDVHLATSGRCRRAAVAEPSSLRCGPPSSRAGLRCPPSWPDARRCPPRRPHPPRGAAVGVTGRTAGARVDPRGRPGVPALVCRHEVAAEHDGVDGHRTFVAAGSTEQHPVHPLLSVDAGDRRLRPDRNPQTATRDDIEGSVRLGHREVGNQDRDRMDTGSTEREDHQVGHVLGPDDEGRHSDREVLTVHPLLELAGREDHRGPCAGDPSGQPGAACGPRWPTPRRGHESRAIPAAP